MVQQVIGAASSGAGDAVRQKAKLSKEYAEGEKALRAGKYKDAAKHLEKARTSDELDIMSSVAHFGYAYRKLDQCGDAIGPLRKVYDLAGKVRRRSGRTRRRWRAKRHSCWHVVIRG